MKKLIITINVTTYEAQTVEGHGSKVVMIPFSASAEGEYFCGKTISDGVDTQYSSADRQTLSARYMLEGTDFKGGKCRLFIENNGTSLENCTPKIITDSKALAFLENATLSAAGECGPDGVVIRIYMN